MKINAMKLINTKDMDRNDWLEWRRKGLGGSDIAGVLNMNPKYTSPLKVYISKVEPPNENEETSEAAEWGNILEPVVRNQFKKRHPELQVRQSNFMWRHPEYDFMVANVDGFLYDETKGSGVLEIKTSSEYRLKEWEGGKVPEEYLLQAQHYLGTLGLSWGWFAVLIGGNKYREFYFERDDELIDLIISMEKDFWTNHVMAQVPPEMDGSEASDTLIKKMYPAESVKEKDHSIALPSEAGKLLEVIDTTKAQIKELEYTKKEAENKLKQFIGEYQVASFFDREIKWQKIDAKKFDVKTFETEHPELYEQYLKQSSYRKLMA